MRESNCNKYNTFLVALVLLFSCSALNAQTLTSASPNKGQLGQQLSVFISGQNVNFFNGSASIQTNFNQGSTSISAPPIDVHQAGTELEVFLDLGNTTYPSGLYDISMNTPAHGVLTLSNAFEIDSVALKSATPRVAFKGQSLNVLIVGQSLNFNNFTVAPTYFGGLNTINTSIVQVRSVDTMEISVNLSSSAILEGNYDLSIPSPGGGVLILRNALEIRTTSISGTVYFDANSNNIQDSGEAGVKNIQVSLFPNGIITRTNSSGRYSFSDLSANTYDVVISPPAGVFTTAPSDTQTVVVNSLNSFDASFGINTTNTAVNISSTASRARCNQNVFYNVRVENTGALNSNNGVYFFVKDSSLTYQAATISQADSVKGDTIYYSFNSLMAFETLRRSIGCNLPSITVLPVGTLISGETNIYLLDATNNIIPGSEKTHVSSTIVRCSFDPNDKLVNPIGSDTLGYIAPGTQLEYTVRFQNTGNDTAFRVVVIDTLSNLLDYSSFEFIDASHDVISTLNASGELTFTFNNIFLVDSATNEPASNGYVSFKINPNINLPDSTTVLNRAGIYFDFNPPIITNYTVNTFALFITSISEVERGIQASVFPNPTSGKLTIELNKNVDNAVLSVYDVKGNRVYRRDKVNKRELQLDLNAYSNGIYFIQISNGIDTYFSKILLNKE